MRCASSIQEAVGKWLCTHGAHKWAYDGHLAGEKLFPRAFRCTREGCRGVLLENQWGLRETLAAAQFDRREI